jgi:sugar phosphate isomerase/epimerase
MTRRTLLASAIGAALRAAVTRDRLSVLADEIGTLDEAIAFAKQYKLKWLEVRAYRPFPAATIAGMKTKLDDAGIGVSFYNSALLKFTLPGTTAVATEEFYENLYALAGLTPDKLYAEREETFKRTIDAALALGVNKIRGFTYWRTADPASMLPRLVAEYKSMVAVAKKSGVTLCVENEYSTNTGTTEETVALIEKVPGLMLNWDPQNSVALGERDVFPNGYRQIPKWRIANVQLKAAGLIGPGEPVDWPGIFKALERDGYKGIFGLETHTLKGPEINVPASHASMKKMLELAGEL